jgi:hypothetical protein
MATPLNLKGGGPVPSHESSMRNLAKARQGGPLGLGAVGTSHALSEGTHSSGIPVAGKGRPVVTGLGNSVATHAFRSWFGNLSQTQANVAVQAARADPRFTELSQIDERHRELRLSHLARMAKFFER